jgi:hypothetical protein
MYTVFFTVSRSSLVAIGLVEELKVQFTGLQCSSAGLSLGGISTAIH